MIQTQSESWPHFSSPKRFNPDPQEGDEQGECTEVLRFLESSAVLRSEVPGNRDNLTLFLGMSAFDLTMSLRSAAEGISSFYLGQTSPQMVHPNQFCT